MKRSRHDDEDEYNRGMRKKAEKPTGSKQGVTLSIVVLTLPVVTVGLLVLARLPVLKHKHSVQIGPSPLRRSFGVAPPFSGVNLQAEGTHLGEDVALTEGRGAVAVLRQVALVFNRATHGSSREVLNTGTQRLCLVPDTF